MDFISSLIKRPISVVMNDLNATPTANDANTTNGSRPCSTGTSRPESPSKLIAAAMNTSINTELTDLLESAAQDLARMEQKNSELSQAKKPDAAHPVVHGRFDSTPEDTIQQLLNEINKNLDEVSCDDDNHIDNMLQIPEHSDTNISSTIAKTANTDNNNLSKNNSLNLTIVHDTSTQLEIYQELSPMASKAKLLMAQTPDPQAQQRNSSFGSLNVGKSETDGEQQQITGPILFAGIDTVVNRNSTKFVGLTEFDESQIPELPGALNADLDAQLKEAAADGDFCGGANMNSTVLHPHNRLTTLRAEPDVEYGSDSEIFVECQSLNSEKCSVGDKSELDTYRSALNDDGESVTTNAALEEQITNEPVYAQLPGDMPTPSEQATVMTEPMHDISSEPMDVDMNETLESANKSLPKIMVFANEDSTDLYAEQVLTDCSSGYATPAPEMVLPESGAEEAEKYENETEKSDEAALIESGTKLEQVDSGVDVSSEKASLMSSSKEFLNSESIKTNLTLDMTGSFSSIKSSAPTSPTFPLKNISGYKHFPNSPHAPQETLGTAFLEKGLNTSSVEERKLSVSKSPVATGIQIVPPTPPKAESEEADMAVPNNVNSSNAILNGTFDNDNEQLQGEERAVVDPTSNKSSRSTFGIGKSLDAIEDRIEVTAELKSVNSQSGRKFDFPQEEIPLSNVSNNVSSMNTILNDTFDNGNAQLQEEDSAEVGPTSKKSSRSTFGIRKSLDAIEDRIEVAAEPKSVNSQSRRTFNFPQATPLSASGQQGLTFSVNSDISTPHTPLDATINYTYLDNANELALPNDSKNPRRTFVMSPEDHISPAVEAIEAMDVDVSMKEVEQIVAPQTSNRLISPPVPALQKRMEIAQQQPLPVTDNEAPPSPPIPPNQQQAAEPSYTMIPPRTYSPPLPAALKRAPIHSDEQQLSAKEQAKIQAKDEKDVVGDKFSNASVMDEVFTAPQSTSSTLSTFAAFAQPNQKEEDEFFDADFQSNLILNPSDFDYLLTKGNNNEQVDRSSLLLKFDPLLGTPIPLNQTGAQQAPKQEQQQLLQVFGNNNNLQQRALSPTIEENEHSFNSETEQQQQQKQEQQLLNEKNCLQQQHQQELQQLQQEQQQQQYQLEQQQQQQKQQREEQQAQNNRRRSVITRAIPAAAEPSTNTTATTASDNIIETTPNIQKSNATMSVDVLDNDTNRSFENRNSQSGEENLNIYNKMDDLEKKIKNEVHKSEDFEKKLRDYEVREENLVKRLTEKEKTVTKMNTVIEAYEKAIAELITEKEQLTQNFELKLNEIKADRDSNYHHLTSLETTFSDLHVKYEKSKEMTVQLKANEDTLIADKKQLMENLRLQEQRYEKMKNHAMQQLETANKKLESLTKEHAIETTKLKALLKKEEISRASITEQLQQKTRENAELVKICDELINGQGS